MPSDGARGAAKEITSKIDFFGKSIDRGLLMPLSLEIAQIIDDAMQPKWIRVEDGLPTETGHYWIKIPGRPVEVGFFKVSLKEFSGYPTVTHWMKRSVPEPPEEG